MLLVVSHRSMFSRWIACILKISIAAGFCPESIGKYAKIAQFILVAHIFMIVFTSVDSVIFVKNQFENSAVTDLEILNEVSQRLFVLFSQFVVVIESYSRRKGQQNFWELYHHIDQRYAYRRHRSLLIYLLKFFEFFTMFCVVNIYYINVVIVNATDYGTLFVISFFCRFRVFYYMFYLQLIACELEIVENEAKQLFEENQKSACNHSMKIQKFQQERFLWLRRYYQLIWELNKCVNYVFGWSNFMNILCVLAVFLTHLNWVYQNILLVETHLGFGKKSMHNA